MRGLLRNEYYSMKRLMLLYAAVLAFYFILGFLIRGSSNRGVPLGLPLYADLFGVVLVIYSFSYEEKSGWSRLVNTLPVSRGKIVRGKYLFSLIVVLTAAAAGQVFWSLSNIRAGIPAMDLWWYCPMVLGGAAALLALLLPLMFLLGAEKGRLMAAVFFFVLMFFGAARQMSGKYISLVGVPVWKILAVSCGGAAVLLVISCLISTVIYNRKEF